MVVMITRTITFFLQLFGFLNEDDYLCNLKNVAHEQL